MNFNSSLIDDDTFTCLGPKTSCLKQNKEKAPKYAYDRNKGQKPRRNKSAFILFSLHTRNQLKSKGGDSLNANEIMMQLGELWKNLSNEEKEPFNQEALKDKLRYQKEIEDFWKENPNEALHNKTKRNHIKKPTSAYGLFLKDVKNSIRQEQPELKMAAIMKIISQRWKCLDEGSKAYYQEKAKKEQEESREKLEKYCAKTASHPKDLAKDTKQRRKNFLRKQVKLDTNECTPVTPIESESQEQSVMTSIYPKNEIVPSFDEFDDFEYQPLPQIVRPTEYHVGLSNAETTQHTSVDPTEAGDSHLLFELSDQVPLMNNFGLSSLNFNFGENAAENNCLYNSNMLQQFMSTFDFDNIFTGNNAFL